MPTYIRLKFHQWEECFTLYQERNVSLMNRVYTYMDRSPCCDGRVEIWWSRQFGDPERGSLHSNGKASNRLEFRDAKHQFNQTSPCIRLHREGWHFPGSPPESNRCSRSGAMEVTSVDAAKLLAPLSSCQSAHEFSIWR